MDQKQHPDEYELVRRDQLEHLQHEVEKIQKNPFGDSRSSKDLLSSMAELNRNVAKLVRIFETANDEIVRDYKDSSSSEKINKVLEQNEKLAKGIVAIADLLKELKGTHPETSVVSAPGEPSPEPGVVPPPVASPVLPQGPAGAPTFEPSFGAPPSNPPSRKPEIEIGDVPPPPPR